MLDRLIRRATRFAFYVRETVKEEWLAVEVGHATDLPEQELTIRGLQEELHSRGANGNSRRAAEALYAAQVRSEEMKHAPAEKTTLGMERLERWMSNLQEWHFLHQEQMGYITERLDKKIDAIQTKAPAPTPETEKTT